jgi:hypothetical protein
MDRGIFLSGHTINKKDLDGEELYVFPGVGIPQCKIPSADQPS